MINGNRLKDICETFIDEAMDYNDLPGLVIGVTCGEEEWTGARGARDFTTKDPMQPGDILHCASVSKLFTSTAIMKLVEEGAIHLDDRLRDLLPDLFEGESRIADKRCDQIYLYQMLSHTAGIGDVDDYHWEDPKTGDGSLSDYVYSAEVTGLPLLCAPGTDGFHYSNVAYEILGHLVSVCSGKSYEAFVHEELMRPAGMTESTMLTFDRLGIKAGQPCPLITEEIRSRNAGSAEGAWHPMALPHEKAEDRSIIPVKYYPYTRSHAPSSTLTSTAADLLKWARAHMGGFAAAENEAAPESAGRALLRPETYRMITREYAEVPKNREKMGLGWFMRRQCGCRLYGHEGTDDGFRASLWLCPEKEIAICVLSNLSKAPVKKLNKRLFERLVR